MKLLKMALVTVGISVYVVTARFMLYDPVEFNARVITTELGVHTTKVN